MALIDQLVNEIRDEVVKDVPKPAKYDSVYTSSIAELVLPKLNELSTKMIEVRDEVNSWVHILTDRRTNACKSMATLNRQHNDCINQLIEIKDMLRYPAQTVKNANDAAVAEYKESLVKACQAYTQNVFNEELFNNVL